ncbi:MAG TPA: zinc ribbon domain-containing protein [Pyrinomonadaceae bacterium]|jgi:hypothetical protein
MSSIPCTNCGAALIPGAKFCRQCGQPSLDAASVSEATTRVFEATAERAGAAAPTETWSTQPTAPAYLAPAGASSLRDASTKSLEPSAPKLQKSWLIVSFAVLFLAVVAAFAIGMLVSRRSTTPTPPVVTRPGTDLPQPPPAPPPPGQQPPASGPSVPNNELMYPGAQTLTDMKSERENFLELRTSDQVEKVVEWYTAKLKPTQIMRRQREAILRTGRTHVIISGRGEATDILIKQGVE